MVFVHVLHSMYGREDRQREIGPIREGHQAHKFIIHSEVTPLVYTPL